MGQCPSSFVPYQGACVRKCPAEAQFLFSVENNQPRCVYKGDQTKKVDLTPVPAMMPVQGKPIPTMEMMKQEDPTRYGVFKEEADRVDAAIAVLMKTIDKQKQVDDAFKTLQDAEGARDSSPDAYELARVAYYSLSKGPEWIEGEKKRVAKVDVDPEIDRYRTAYTDISKRQTTQQRTQDVMRSVKDGVLSLKDDFQYTTKTFKNQIDTLKNQINIERRGREKPDSSDEGFFTWINLILNLLIVVGLLYAGIVLWGKMPSVAPPAPEYVRLAS